MSRVTYSPLLLTPCGAPFGPSPLPVSTMPSADFCRTVREILTSLSHVSVTYSRSPEVSTTAFSAQPPDLRLRLGWIWTSRSYARSSDDHASYPVLVHRLALLLGASFRHRLAANALALRYPSPPSGLEKTFTSKLSYMLGTRKYPPAEPEALRLMAPQRGLISTGKAKPTTW